MMGNSDMGRVLEGSSGSESPDLRMGMTSADFQTCAKVFVENELLIKLVIIGRVTGKLSFRILAVTLSYPGALFDDRLPIIFPTSFSVTGRNSNFVRWSSSRLLFIEQGMGTGLRNNMPSRKAHKTEIKSFHYLT